MSDIVLKLVIASVLLAGLAVQTSAQDAQLAFNNVCRTCHTTVSGDNRLGPNLANIIGRQAGSVEGYEYSSAMKNANFKWDAAKLDKFIEDPDSVVPGNNMKPYSGHKNAEDRAKIVAYLSGAKTLAD